MESQPESKTHNWGIKWTEEEDFRLLQAIELFGGQDWKKISDFVGTRDTVKCIQRWDKVLRPDLVKGKWTEEEDDRLRYVVQQSFEHWGKVAEQMPGRTAKQCRERWTNYLDPTLIKTPFTPTEDEILLHLQAQMGNKWAAIARQINGRTENAVKLRYHALVKMYNSGGNRNPLLQQALPTQDYQYQSQTSVGPASSNSNNYNHSMSSLPLDIGMTRSNFDIIGDTSHENAAKRPRISTSIDDLVFAPVGLDNSFTQLSEHSMLMLPSTYAHQMYQVHDTDPQIPLTMAQSSVLSVVNPVGGSGGGSIGSAGDGHSSGTYAQTSRQHPFMQTEVSPASPLPIPMQQPTASVALSPSSEPLDDVDVPDDVPDNIPDDVPDYVPDNIPDNIPDDVPDDVGAVDAQNDSEKK